MYKNSSIWDDLKYQYQTGGMTTRLIFLNIIVFVAVYSIFAILWLFEANSFKHTLRSFLTLPADLMTLITRPWTLITYMFMHAGVFHILFNMLFLYWFGKIFAVFLDEKKILPLYIYGGLSGAALFLIGYNVLPVFTDLKSVSTLLGASGSVLAVIFATTTLVPDYEIRLILFGNVKIKYIALFVLFVNIITIPNGNAGGNFAHLGGALFGYLFIASLKNGNDWSIGFYKTWDSLKEAFSFKSSPRPKVVYRSKKVKQSASAGSGPEDATIQEKTDQILDKISRSGYDSLSKDEKEFLFRISKEDK